MDSVQILDVAQPIVDDTKLFLGQRSCHTTTAIVTADDDVTHFEDFDRVLEHREQVHVGVCHHVGDVTVYKDLTGIQVDDLVGRHT